MRNETQGEFIAANRCGASYVAEEIVRELMGDTFDASQDEDKYQDIDFWYQKQANQTIPVSVKYMRVAERTGKIAFELEVTYDDDTIPRYEKEWFKSWYYNGMARFYAIVIGNRVLLVNKAGLDEYIGTHGWLCVVTLSRAAKLSQENHAHKDAKSGLIAIDTAIEKGFAHWHYTLTDEQVARLTKQRRCDSVVLPTKVKPPCSPPILKLQSGCTNHRPILKSTQTTGGMLSTRTVTLKPPIKTYARRDG